MGCGKVSNIGADTGGAGGSAGSTGGVANGGVSAGGSGGVANGGSGNAGSGTGGTGTAGSAFGGGPGTGGSSAGESGIGGTGGFAGGGSFVDEGFSVSEFQLGTTNPDGTPSSSAWQYYGDDIDGLTSSQASSNHCTLQAGANSSVKRDGPDGVDNSFGANILPLLLNTDSSVEQELNARAQAGESIAIATGPGLGVVLPGSMGRANTFTGNTLGDWWVSDQDYPGGNANCPLEGETLNGEIYIWGQGFWELPLTLAGSELLVRVRRPAIRGIQAANGLPTEMRLTGLIRTEELVESLRQVAGALDPSLCSGSTFDSIAQQVRAASDIRDDGTNGDPSLECNAISFGIGVKLSGALIRGFVHLPETPKSCP